jgi:hypothetical protein
LDLIQKGYLNVGNLSAGLIVHWDYSARQQMLAVCEVNFIPTVSSLAFISLQDLKDFMAKAGDVAYTSVQRPKAGEGYVLFFPQMFRPVNGSALPFFQLDPDPAFHVDGDRNLDSALHVRS